MKAKVFIVIDHLGAGGAQRQVIEYLKHANREKFQITVMNLDKDYAPMQNEIEALRYRVISIKHSGFFNPSTIIQLIKLFKQEKPDIVHTYLFTADCYGRLAARLTKAPVIISSVRNIDLWMKWHHVLADRVLEKFTDKITVNAECIKTYLTKKEKINPDKIVIIYNGLDANRFKNLRNVGEVRQGLNISKDAYVVGMVSRFSGQKDYETFLEAAKIVLEKAPDTYFIAVGDGLLLKSLKSQASSPKLKENVIFTGLRRDVPDLINAMDVCVLSSHYEGCPNVILEYMACSRPVVASDVGGCKELVLDGGTGFIVPEADPQALADKLIVLLKDAGLREKMGSEGRKRVEQEFNSEKMAQSTERLYMELLESKRSKLEVI